MEISKEDFERAVELAFKRGCVRDKNLFISDKDVRSAILDLYKLLKIEAPKQPVEADAPFQWTCSICGSVLMSNENKHCPCTT